MPVRRRRSKRRQRVLSAWQVWASDGTLDDVADDQKQDWLTLEYFSTPTELAALWNEHGAPVLEAWEREHPGTKPRRWHQYA